MTNGFFFCFFGTGKVDAMNPEQIAGCFLISSLYPLYPYIYVCLCLFMFIYVRKVSRAEAEEVELCGRQLVCVYVCVLSL